MSEELSPQVLLASFVRSATPVVVEGRRFLVGALPETRGKPYVTAEDLTKQINGTVAEHALNLAVADDLLEREKKSAQLPEEMRQLLQFYRDGGVFDKVGQVNIFEGFVIAYPGAKTEGEPQQSEPPGRVSYPGSCALIMVEQVAPTNSEDPSTSK